MNSNTYDKIMEDYLNYLQDYYDGAFTFNAPDIIRFIKDIANIYDVNDDTYAEYKQCEKQFDVDRFIDLMSVDMVEKYEKMMNLVVLPTMTIEQRKQQIKDHIIDELYYSYNIFVKHINRMLGTTNQDNKPYQELRDSLGYYTFLADTDAETATLRLGLERKEWAKIVFDYTENIIPYNMILTMYIDYNRWGGDDPRHRIKWFSIGDLEAKEITYKNMYDEPLYLKYMLNEVNHE